VNSSQIIYRVVEALVILYCAIYFTQLGRAKTERMSEARRRLAEKLPFLANPKVCFAVAVALVLFAVFRIADLVHTLYGPF
jgi:uncharacterized membrane protein YkvI